MRWVLGPHFALGAILFSVLGRFTPESQGGEWPQILGPRRNGVADHEKLAATWPAEGPRQIWRRDVGRGYAGVAVAEQKLILFHREGDQEVCEALDPATGKRLWRQSFAVRYESAIAPDDGPRCVPLIHKGYVFLLGVSGNLRCLALEDGRQRWSRSLETEYSIPPSYFGVGSTPLIAGDMLLVNVGGRQGAGILACRLADGGTVWTSTEEQASYSSPVLATVGSVQHAIFVTRLKVVSVDPATGKERFSFPFGQRGPTVNAATPIVIGDRLFVTASYGIGARWAKITSTAADILWESDQILSSQYTTCVPHQGWLYGIDGRQDQGAARLKAFDPAAQKIGWTVEDFGTGHLILADGKLVILKTDGHLVLAEANPQRFDQLARAKVLSGTAQPLPALADGRLYVRDDRELKCLDLR